MLRPVPVGSWKPPLQGWSQSPHHLQDTNKFHLNPQPLHAPASRPKPLSITHRQPSTRRENLIYQTHPLGSIPTHALSPFFKPAGEKVRKIILFRDYKRRRLARIYEAILGLSNE
ncbi:unnamed protein product, partial [Nesidiocoris tenuis]